MRQKLLTYTLSAALAGLILWACQRDRFGHDDPNAVEPTLTVGEARDFFEYQFSEMLPYMTKATGDRPVGMTPGDFTPLWDKARIGANREMDGADVPIDPKFIFVAVFNRITEKGDTVRQTVDITQKLVVKKWRNTEEYEAFCYIASIVPTPEYYARHKNVAKDFQYAGSKGEFSGFVIYRTLAGKLVGIDNYENGRRTRHDYFPRITEQNTDSVYSIARLSVPEMEVQAGTAAAFSMDMEGEDPCNPIVTDPVLCTATRPSGVCRICGSRGGCSCWWPDNWGDHSGSGGGNQGGGTTAPDYNDGGNTGGGGGGNGNHSSGPSVPPVQEKDCSGSAGENAASAQMMYGAFNNAGLQEFINSKINDSDEWSISLNYNSLNGTYSLGNEKRGNGGSVTPGFTGGATYTTALVHTHPSSGMPHSIADVAALIDIYERTTGKTHTSFVAIRQSNGSSVIYAIQIENETQAQAFYNTYNQTLANQITNEAQNLFNDIHKNSGNMDESYAYAMSYLLNKYNTGVKILKCENGNFKQKEATVSNNTITRTTCK